ncbi:hypothetical protein [Ancylobacter amanitiformis]|uniref:Uncharacterized protein n=1 Tax=Ancylobacter amanitiformis TaxID=217069 RepID=A0ABU0LXV1_9HYPH|nr:hypothetical protein [Ancylobacter amanitiformis]MDQ0513519.1 hypothetical protein [Ancylobacter amanitiformis]
MAQTPNEIDLVRKAQRSAYAITSATNGCPKVDEDVRGWPKYLIRRCEYRQGNLTGLVYLAEVPAKTVAAWISRTCARKMPEVASCFGTVLRCGQLNSGYMFPVAGNIIEDGRNFFFRNGMTVNLGDGTHASRRPIPLKLQEELAQRGDAQILSIPSGLTRYWRSRPHQVAVLFPDKRAPEAVNTAEQRALWLRIARDEFLSAARGRENRLLEAYVAVHRDVLARGQCPL